MACLLVLAGHVVGYADLLLFRHAICAVDGALTHSAAPADSHGCAPHDSAHGHASLLAGAHRHDAEPPTGPVLDLPIEAGEHHEHHHCLSVLCTKERPLPEQRGVLLTATGAGRTATWTVAEPILASRIPLYRLAPKNSPPIA